MISTEETGPALDGGVLQLPALTGKRLGAAINVASLRLQHHVPFSPRLCTGI